MKLKTKIMKVGNSYALVIPSAYIKTRLLEAGKFYEIDINTREDKIIYENDLLKRKLDEANAILEKKNLKPIVLHFNKEIKSSGERI